MSLPLARVPSQSARTTRAAVRMTLCLTRPSSASRTRPPRSAAGGPGLREVTPRVLDQHRVDLLGRHADLAETRDHLLEEMGRAPVGHHLGGQARSTPPPAPHGVVREHDLPFAAEADEPDQCAQPGTVRMQELEPEAVEADVPPAV